MWPGGLKPGAFAKYYITSFRHVIRHRNQDKSALKSLTTFGVDSPKCTNFFTHLEGVNWNIFLNFFFWFEPLKIRTERPPGTSDPKQQKTKVSSSSWTISRVMVQLELKTPIFHHLGSKTPKSRSVLAFRGPPGPVCHTQKENSFSQFVRIRPDFSHFCQLKGALQVEVQVEPN